MDLNDSKIETISGEYLNVTWYYVSKLNSFIVRFSHFTRKIHIIFTIYKYS